MGREEVLGLHALVRRGNWGVSLKALVKWGNEGGCAYILFEERRGGRMLILNYLKGKGVNLLALVRAIGRGKPACSDEEGKG